MGNRTRPPAKKPPRQKPLPPGRSRAGDNGLGLGSSSTNGYGQGLRAVFDRETGLGSDMRQTRFVFPRILDEYELTALGMDGLAQRVLSYPVTRALACGYEIEFSSDVPEELRERLLQRAADNAQRLRVDATVGLLAIRARQYGDAIQAMSFASDLGATSLRTPPAWGQRVRWTSVWDRRDYFPLSYEPIESERYRTAAWLHLMIGRPLLEAERWYGYRTGGSSQVPLHPRRYTRLHTVSGFSILQNLAPYLVSLLAAAQGASNLIQRASLGHFRIRDWAEMVRSRGGEAQAIMQGQFAAMSSNNVVVTDGIGEEANEDYEQHNTSLAGIDAGIYASAFLFCGASGMPISRTMGTSPGTFQSGEVQDNMWYELLGDLQQWIESALRWNWDACFAEEIGSAHAPEYVIRFRSPRVMADDKALDLRTKALDQAIKGMAATLLTPEAACAALNSDSPGAFNFAPAAKPAPVEPTTMPAQAAAAEPGIDPGDAPAEGQPLAEVALNGAQVQSLVSVATDPILSMEAKQAIIAAAYPSIPANLVAIIAQGGASVAPAGPATAVPGTGPAAAPGAVAPAAAPAADEDGDVPDSGPPEEPDLWRTPEQIAERFGAITSGQLKRHAASAPKIKEAGKLTWIKTGRSRLYKLSDVEALWSVGGDDLDEGTEDDPSADDALPIGVDAALESGRVERYLTRRMWTVCDLRPRSPGEVPDAVIVGKLTGTYPEPKLVAGWQGWIEHEGGIAFVHTAGVGLWWPERDARGGVVGMPVVFARPA